MDIHIHLNINITAADSHSESADIAPKERMLSEILNERMAYAKTSRSYSTQNNYQTAARSFSRYLGRDIRMSEINAGTIADYERWLRLQSVCPNTISCYMRTLRSMLSRDDNDMHKLFEHVFTGKAKTDKRSLPIQVIMRLQQLSLPAGSFIELTRDVFLFSFYAMGMPFVDVAHLRWQQVEADHFTYLRQKTGQRIVVAMLPYMQQIIDKHRQEGEFVFPLMHSGDDAEYQLVLGRYNRNLRQLGKKVESPIVLTSYVVRHSWATAAYQHNIGLSVISKALGHANPNTTLTYLREIDEPSLRAANIDLLKSFSLE